MKTFKLLSILIIIIGLSQCGSAKFQKNPPFQISSSTYYNEFNNTETNIYIRYTSKDDINFDSIYFQKRKGKVEIKTISDLNYIFGNFKNFKRNDLVLDVNSIKELNNRIPEIKKFPFDLKENEAIISYKTKGKTKYYKITSVKKGKSPFSL